MAMLRNSPRSWESHADKRPHRRGHDHDAVRHTEAWQRETFAEEQARWERADPAYARVCEAVRDAKRSGEEALRRADGAKAEWDARVATQRETDDHALKARHALFMSSGPLAPEAIAEPTCVPDQPATAPGVAGKLLKFVRGGVQA